MATVGQCIMAYHDMKKLYPFDDDRTTIQLRHNPVNHSNMLLSVETMDVDTGIAVQMSKDIAYYDYIEE